METSLGFHHVHPLAGRDEGEGHPGEHGEADDDDRHGAPEHDLVPLDPDPEVHQDDAHSVQRVIEDGHHQGQVEADCHRMVEGLHERVELVELARGDDDDVGAQIEDEDEAADPEEQPGPHAGRLPETRPHVGGLARFCAQESTFLSYFLRPST